MNSSKVKRAAMRKKLSQKGMQMRSKIAKRVIEDLLDDCDELAIKLRAVRDELRAVHNVGMMDFRGR